MQRSHIERGKRWGARHLSDHESLAQAGGEKKKRGNGLIRPEVLYPLLKMRLVDITAEVLKEWQKMEAETRANNARRGFVHVSACGDSHKPAQHELLNQAGTTTRLSLSARAYLRHPPIQHRLKVVFH